MKEIWEFFENLDEYVYVTDVKTNELIYMNRKTMETYGYDSVEQIKGKKCYQILQNSSMPCKMWSIGLFSLFRHIYILLFFIHSDNVIIIVSFFV